MTSTELWRPVPGYEGFYEASSKGRVRSLSRLDSRGHRRKGRVLSAGPSGPEGRLTVALSKNGSSRTHWVHQLVLLAFTGPRPPGMVACHGNGNPLDNRLENLRWDTIAANFQDQRVHGTNHNARKTHCPRGHAYTAENTYIQSKGSRVCRECMRERYRAVKREERMAS